MVLVVVVILPQRLPLPLGVRRTRRSSTICYDFPPKIRSRIICHHSIAGVSQMRVNGGPDFLIRVLDFWIPVLEEEE